MMVWIPMWRQIKNGDHPHNTSIKVVNCNTRNERRKMLLNMLLITIKHYEKSTRKCLSVYIIRNETNNMCVNKNSKRLNKKQRIVKKISLFWKNPSNKNTGGFWSTGQSIDSRLSRNCLNCRVEIKGVEITWTNIIDNTDVKNDDPWSTDQLTLNRLSRNSCLNYSVSNYEPEVDRTKVNDNLVVIKVNIWPTYKGRNYFLCFSKTIKYVNHPLNNKLDHKKRDTSSSVA